MLQKFQVYQDKEIFRKIRRLLTPKAWWFWIIKQSNNKKNPKLGIDLNINL